MMLRFLDEYQIEEDEKLKRTDPEAWVRRMAQYAAYDAEEDMRTKMAIELRQQREALLSELAREKVWTKAKRDGARMQHILLVRTARAQGRQDIAEWLQAQELPDFGVKSL